MNKNRSLTLAFSCLGNTLTSLLNNLELITAKENLKILVIVQKWEAKQPEQKSKKIDLVFLDNIGLSRSRNAAIKHANTNYIWFLDDDVALENTDIDDVLNIIQTGVTEFYRVKVGCIEWKNKLFKNYKKLEKVRKINLLQVSSIEIIANLDYVKKSQLLFNENIGLGTVYPSNEENNFLIDAWDSGAKFTFIDKVLIRHTCIFDDRILASDKIFEIKGATASRFNFLGVLLLCRWFFRFSIFHKNLGYGISLIKGFLRGYKHYK